MCDAVCAITQLAAGFMRIASQIPGWPSSVAAIPVAFARMAILAVLLVAVMLLRHSQPAQDGHGQSGGSSVGPDTTLLVSERLCDKTHGR